METHHFTLILSGLAELTPQVSNALYEATGGDIELQITEGVATIDFEREGGSLRDVILTAVRQVESSGVGVRVVRVDSEAANVIAKINADLLGTPAA